MLFKLCGLSTVATIATVILHQEGVQGVTLEYAEMQA